jgi:hypothetical protein
MVQVGQRTQPLTLGGKAGCVLTLAAVEAMQAPDGVRALGLVFRERPSFEDLRLVLPQGTMLQFEDPPGSTQLA